MRVLARLEPLPGRWSGTYRRQLDENQLRTLALGRSNWLFAGSLCSGHRDTAVMRLIQSARTTDLAPYA